MIQISDRTRFFLVAVLTLASGLGLSASLHLPGVLLDDQSFAADFVDTARCSSSPA